jgi:hypothetical protein
MLLWFTGECTRTSPPSPVFVVTCLDLLTYCPTLYSPTRAAALQARGAKLKLHTCGTPGGVLGVLQLEVLRNGLLACLGVLQAVEIFRPPCSGSAAMSSFTVYWQLTGENIGRLARASPFHSVLSESSACGATSKDTLGTKPSPGPIRRVSTWPSQCGGSARCSCCRYARCGSSDTSWLTVDFGARSNCSPTVEPAVGPLWAFPHCIGNLIRTLYPDIRFSHV